MAIECFEIKWTKPFSLEDVANQTEVDNKGVYIRFIVSRNKKTPHYLGKSTDFRERSRYHRLATAHLGSDLKKYHISLGVVYSFERTEMTLGCTPSQLKDIENYLRNKLRLKGNDPSTLKGYNGSPIVIINTGVVPKPIQKIMSHNPNLLKLITESVKPKRKPASSSWGI
jgi:hypothetical protein